MKLNKLNRVDKQKLITSIEGCLEQTKVMLSKVDPSEKFDTGHQCVISDDIENRWIRLLKLIMDDSVSDTKFIKEAKSIIKKV